MYGIKWTNFLLFRSRPEQLSGRGLASVTSMDAEEVGGVERSATVGIIDKLALRGRRGSGRTRPLSEASSVSSRDLEASFEVSTLSLVTHPY